eukprot:gb/GECH01008958.1/.p1 GENE.gb/GECH01008958.1/~~gb/GECH01008958.1/.p1  ORF type:complete len:142 (+),score=12.01 gb/GECH01008958.1/:1-426(+)
MNQSSNFLSDIIFYFQAYARRINRKYIQPWWRIGLGLLIWGILLWFAVQIEFGVVFGIISVFVLVYLGLDRTSRNRRRQDPNAKKGLSAWSVFNPNFEKVHWMLPNLNVRWELLDMDKNREMNSFNSSNIYNLYLKMNVKS